MVGFNDINNNSQTTGNENLFRSGQELTTEGTWIGGNSSTDLATVSSSNALASPLPQAPKTEARWMPALFNQVKPSHDASAPSLDSLIAQNLKKAKACIEKGDFKDARSYYETVYFYLEEQLNSQKTFKNPKEEFLHYKTLLDLLKTKETHLAQAHGPSDDARINKIVSTYEKLAELLIGDKAGLLALREDEHASLTKALSRSQDPELRKYIEMESDKVVRKICQFFPNDFETQHLIEAKHFLATGHFESAEGVFKAVLFGMKESDPRKPEIEAIVLTLPEMIRHQEKLGKALMLLDEAEKLGQIHGEEMIQNADGEKEETMQRFAAEGRKVLIGETRELILSGKANDIEGAIEIIDQKVKEEAQNNRELQKFKNNLQDRTAGAFDKKRDPFYWANLQFIARGDAFFQQVRKWEKADGERKASLQIELAQWARGRRSYNLAGVLLEHVTKGNASYTMRREAQEHYDSLVGNGWHISDRARDLLIDIEVELAITVAGSLVGGAFARAAEKTLEWGSKLLRARKYIGAAEFLANRYTIGAGKFIASSQGFTATHYGYAALRGRAHDGYLQASAKDFLTLGAIGAGEKLFATSFAKMALASKEMRGFVRAFERPEVQRVFEQEAKTLFGKSAKDLSEAEKIYLRLNTAERLAYRAGKLTVEVHTMMLAAKAETALHLAQENPQHLTYLDQALLNLKSIIEIRVGMKGGEALARKAGNTLQTLLERSRKKTPSSSLILLDGGRVTQDSRRERAIQIAKEKYGLTPENVEQKFEELALQHHPDHGGNAEAFMELRALRDILRNKDSQLAKTYLAGKMGISSSSKTQTPIAGRSPAPKIEVVDFTGMDPSPIPGKKPEVADAAPPSAWKVRPLIGPLSMEQAKGILSRKPLTSSPVHSPLSANAGSPAKMRTENGKGGAVFIQASERKDNEGEGHAPSGEERKKEGGILNRLGNRVRDFLEKNKSPASAEKTKVAQNSSPVEVKDPEGNTSYQLLKAEKGKNPPAGHSRFQVQNVKRSGNLVTITGRTWEWSSPHSKDSHRGMVTEKQYGEPFTLEISNEAARSLGLLGEGGEVNPKPTALWLKETWIPGRPYVQRVVRERYEGGISRYVAFRGGKPVGDFTVKEEADGGIFIKFMNTPPEHRKKGVAESLFAAATEGKKSVRMVVIESKTGEALKKAWENHSSLRAAFENSPLGKICRKNGFFTEGEGSFLRKERNGSFEVTATRPAPTDGIPSEFLSSDSKSESFEANGPRHGDRPHRAAPGGPEKRGGRGERHGGRARKAGIPGLRPGEGKRGRLDRPEGPPTGREGSRGREMPSIGTVMNPQAWVDYYQEMFDPVMEVSRQAQGPMKELLQTCSSGVLEHANNIRLRHPTLLGRRFEGHFLRTESVLLTYEYSRLKNALFELHPQLDPALQPFDLVQEVREIQNNGPGTTKEKVALLEKTLGRVMKVSEQDADYLVQLIHDLGGRDQLDPATRAKLATAVQYVRGLGGQRPFQLDQLFLTLDKLSPPLKDPRPLALQALKKTLLALFPRLKGSSSEKIADQGAELILKEFGHEQFPNGVPREDRNESQILESLYQLLKRFMDPADPYYRNRFWQNEFPNVDLRNEAQELSLDKFSRALKKAIAETSAP